ncbi:amidase [Ancylobacter sp. A5.8]|uniref:amidase n=1 Tax=Ancylobacter gelatini TaxID=2919920 RepID=UPI001F4E0634|nr:amidase [Ancylobacter gelatini]MCJ8142297.1 amidase [Ancylobacter gelatini]
MPRSQIPVTSSPSATEIATAVVKGRRTAVEIAEAAIARIETLNPALNAIVTFDPDRMRDEARTVDRRVAAGERLPLAGVPVAVKDNIWVAGRRVTQGSRLFADFIAPEDAVAVKRLREAGAVIAGMANTSEFAAKGVTTNLLFGPTRHPMDPRLTPGGSSGGPAVAVAAGLVPLALGTDAGGSSRRPPAHVGIIGFKPSFGAIPYGPGFAEPFVGLSVMAPMARTVADAALMFEVLAGRPPRRPPKPLSDLRIAFSPRLGLEVPVDDDVAEAIGQAVGHLDRAGARIERRDPLWPADASETALMALQHAGLAAIHGETWRRDPALFDPDIGRQIERGLSLSGVEVAHALQLSSAIERSAAAFFSEVDLLIGPTTPCVSWPLTQLGPERIGGIEVEPRAHAVFTPLFNHAKVPALSLPIGNGRDDLPVGLQIIGARGSDLDVLAFAAFAEHAMDGEDDALVDERLGR